MAKNTKCRLKGAHHPNVSSFSVTKKGFRDPAIEPFVVDRKNWPVKEITKALNVEANEKNP